MKINMIAYTIITLAFITFMAVDPRLADKVLLVGCLYFLVRIADKLYEK